MVRNSQDLKNETTLWELFRNGEESAFSALFELTSDKLYRYGTKFVSDEESVKDCIQELFIKLYENRQQLPALSNPLFYLFSSLKNLLIDRQRGFDSGDCSVCLERLKKRKITLKQCEATV